MMNRARLLAALLVTLALVAAACGDDDDAASTSASASESASAADTTSSSSSQSASASTPAEEATNDSEEAEASASAYPRTVAHVQGETEILEAPVRVVAGTSFAELDTLLGLDVEVAVRGTYGEELLQSKIDAGAADLDVWEISWPPSVEAVAELEPDIVFVSFGDGVYNEFYDPVAAVAPTLVLPAGDLEEQVRIVGEALALDQEQIDAALAEIDATFESFNPARTPETVMMIIDFCAPDVYYWQPTSGPGVLLERLGFTVPEMEGGDPSGGANISLENLDLLDADFLLLSTDTEADANLEEGCVTELYNNPAFQALPVFQEGNVGILTPEESRAFDTNSILNVETLVRGLERVLAE